MLIYYTLLYSTLGPYHTPNIPPTVEPSLRFTGSYDIAGTFVAGVSLACCSRPQRDNVDCTSLLLVNVWVAVFQLISSILFLVGYIWSIIWGFNFISISSALILHYVFLICRLAQLNLL